MKIEPVWCIALCLLAPVAPLSAAAAPVSFLVETEDFQFCGEWLEEREPEASGGRFLRTPGAVADAITVIPVPQSGLYTVWVRARDYLEYPGKRRFKLAVDGDLFEAEFGAHGVAGWQWEKAGQRELPAGDHVLALRDSARFYGRADALLFTTGELDPNALPNPAKTVKRLAPKQVAALPVTDFAAAPACAPGEPREVARLENEHLRVRFLSAADVSGKAQVIRTTELRTAQGWRSLEGDPCREKLFVLAAAKTEWRRSSFRPSWVSEPASAPLYRFTVGSKSYEAMAGRSNPFFAAPAQALVGRAAQPTGPGVVEVSYESASGGKASGRWALRSGARDLEVSITFTAPQDGWYSIGFSPFRGWGADQVQFNLLPPLFQFQRQPETPLLVPSNVTPQPLALVQVDQEGQAMSLGVAADPACLPFVWADADNPVYGFSLLNADGATQPTVFSPVLGQKQSHIKQGETRTVSWRVLACSGDWKQTLEYASREVFGVTDYRKPYSVSLSDAALNMVELMKDPDASGWNAERKGFWNIETTNVASQASPLTVLSAALLTGDETLYRERALPTIEYTLSRPQAHFGMEVPATRAAYISAEGTRIKVPSDFYGTAYWQGLHDLLGRRNPWLPEIALPAGQVRHRTGYSSLPRWSEMLGAYRLNPSPDLLREIEAEAGKFLSHEVYGRKTRDLGDQPFYNVSYYPYWWDLLDLFEATGNRTFLDAAEECAFFTIAGQWSHPRIPEGELTIHPGGEYAGEPHLWFKGDQPFRLGVPRPPGATPQKSVPAWLVAQVGLGLEQPCTYYTSKGGMRNIMMSAWAPHLLRLYRHTGREIYLIYARNAVISRFGNYPGYYISGYTDLHLAPDYPFRGPDVTSIYYHHIPPHLAFTLDFLVAEAEQRSQGRVRFPWVKQQGYVWFSNRLYGHAPGEVFGDPQARLWLDRKSVQVRTPEVNWLLARGGERLWVILMNESASPVNAPVALDRSALELTGEAATLFQADGKAAPVHCAGSMSIAVPGKGLVALSFPAKAMPRQESSPLQGGRVSLPLPGEWGSLEAFRIRSPFGQDSLFAVLTGRPRDGGGVTLQLEGAAPQEEIAYPYEFSVYPWPMNRDLRFTLRLRDGAGAGVETSPVVLPGTP